MTDEEKKIRMKNCDHVFAIIHGGRRPGAYHQRRFCTNPVIECVKCGLTNKNINTEKVKEMVKVLTDKYPIYK